jgi:sigma-B regulation protein RsbU (phosphoserine phosphatase)
MVFGKAYLNGNVELCIAGHNPPLLIQDGKVQTINATGVPVGLFCESEYELSRITLRKGDSLILYTDGLTEASIDEIEYGEERLKLLLENSNVSSAKSLLNTIVNDQRNFLKDATLFDDITISVIAKS